MNFVISFIIIYCISQFTFAVILALGEDNYSDDESTPDDES